MSDHGRFIWYELITPDTAGAKRFYGDVVGWTAQGMPPNWTGYICVDDCDAAADKIKRLGGAVRQPPTDIPGIGRFAVVADPAGAVFAIMKPIPPEGSRPPPNIGAVGQTGWHEL